MHSEVYRGFEPESLLLVLNEKLVIQPDVWESYFVFLPGGCLSLNPLLPNAWIKSYPFSVKMDPVLILCHRRLGGYCSLQKNGFEVI